LQRGNVIWLSHALDSKTPAYRGGPSLVHVRDKRMDAGDHCNSSYLMLPNHVGTHVDVPRHFMAEGAAVDDYAASQWVFSRAIVLETRQRSFDVLTADDLMIPRDADRDADMVLVRTHFEEHRGTDQYWSQQFPIHPNVADRIVEEFPKIRAFGVDTLSIGSPLNREFNHALHRKLLSRGILIFEDLKLTDIPDSGLSQVVALPLRVVGIDGAPCSIIGWLAT
jgi:arylformamidase